MKIEWSGRPNFIGYLTSCKEISWKLLVTVAILWYEKFQIGIMSRIYIGIMAAYILYALIRCAGFRYYITSKGPVVKSGRKYYFLQWDDLVKEEYFVRVRPIEWLIGCRTFEFTRNYQASRKDVWREQARFWAVRGHRELDEIIRKHLKK